ncbi:serine protease [Companilactobacillus sp. RD055328]|uniref:S1C family serine protease n=1 Tax=Companilactobacillus sp. RD055328 TaxID=2916634 RepID=UPI001FC87DAC|nr:serine protease [Companilactobacillus sp. RD055328]
MGKINSTGKTIIIAIVAALFGGAASGVIVSRNMSTINNTQKAGTTETVETTKSKTQMGAAFKSVSSAVVSVINYQKKTSSASDSLAELFGGSSSSSQSSDSLEKYGEGSGAIYSNKDGKGYIVTNNHVVSDADKLEIIFKDGSKTEGKLIGTDEVTDLAVIEISGDEVPATAEFGDSDKITEGDPVIAIGSPLGSDYATSVTEGIISSKSRTITTQDQTTGQDIGQATVIQTDAAINPGNSGGPLVNSSGQIIGINSMKLASSDDGTSVEGMGFAIPSNEVVKIINDLVENGEVKRPSLGIGALTLDQISKQDQSDTFKLPSSITGGILIGSVTDNAPASKAGLKKYDVITKIDDKKVDSIATLHSIIYSHDIGDKVTVTYYRDGKQATTELTLTEVESN